MDPYKQKKIAKITGSSSEEIDDLIAIEKRLRIFVNGQNVLNLFVEGESRPVGVTAHHLFWSETQQTFVPAGSLAKGEELRGYSGDSMRVVNLLPRPGPTANQIQV